MVSSELRLSEYLLVENDDTKDEIVLKARDEVGRGKRFGMSGEIELEREEAEAFAKWVFASEFDD